MTCDMLSADELHRFVPEYYARNRPVIIRGLREKTKLKIFDWSAEYFERVLGDTPVPVMTTATGFLSYERDMTPLPFRDFVARSFGPGASRDVRYYFKNPVSVLPAGHDDSEQLPVLGPFIAGAVLRNLWISAGGITVGLHFDPAENFNFQLRGEKIFDLYTPGTRAYYPMPMLSQTATISGVFREGLTPDLEKFPRFDPGRGTRVHLLEGDMLYVPAYWWHQVTSLGDENVNLNFWWVPSARKQLAHPNQALRGHLQLALRYLKYGNIQSAPRATESRP